MLKALFKTIGCHLAFKKAKSVSFGLYLAFFSILEFGNPDLRECQQIST